MDTTLSKRHLIINAVSVFRPFSTRYFGICQFFVRYCGTGYPPMSPSFSHVSVRIMIEFIFCIISLIFWDPKQANKCFYCKTQDEFTGNSKVVDVQRNSKCVLPILLTRSWGLKSTFIITNWRFQRNHHGDWKLLIWWSGPLLSLSLSIDLLERTKWPLQF